jgi:histidinol-phosphate phosphatase family protein
MRARRVSGGARRPAVFLDRDGTLVEDVDYLTRPEDLRLIPGAAEAVAALNRAGFAVVLVTNQSAVARGWLAEETLEEIHRLLREELARQGAQLDGVYVCPHHPTEGCRKPAPGLLVRAARELDLELARSIAIGDAARDLDAARAIGLPGVLVLTGQGTRQLDLLAREGRAPAHVARDLAAAARILIGDQEGRGAERGYFS